MVKQESPAVADKPARRESMPKIAPILIDVLTTLSLTIVVYLYSFSCVASEIGEISRNSLKIQTFIEFGVIQGHRHWCQSKAHMQLPISHK